MDLSWKITKLTAYNTLSGFDDVVCHAKWTLRGTVTGSDSKEYSSEFPGATPLTVGTLTLSSFTPYEELTQDQVIGWVKDTLGEEQVTSIETGLATQIEQKLHPTDAQGLPWGS